MWSAIKLHIFRLKAPKKEPKEAPKEAPRKPWISTLDEPALSKIFEKLSLIDQVCLSLSCKRFFKLFGAIAKREEILFPRLLHIGIPGLCVNNPEVLRNQLLVRLENDRWACCGRCLRLHPREEFTEISLENPPLKRTCTPDAGIVDFCPCVSLTLRDRARVIELLQSSKRPLRDTYWPFHVFLDARGRPFLLHDCVSTNAKAGYRVIIRMVLFIESDQLMMRALYVIDCFSSQPSLEPVFVCPHVDLFLALERDAMPDICPHCGTKVEWYPGPGPPKHTSPLNMDVTRELGKCEWRGDYQWFKQCRINNRYLSYRILW